MQNPHCVMRGEQSMWCDQWTRRDHDPHELVRPCARRSHEQRNRGMSDAAGCAGNRSSGHEDSDEGEQEHQHAAHDR